MEMEVNGKKTSCELHFKGLSSWINNEKQILKQVSGKFDGGSLIAILGPSGSGKTTFLNILSGYRYQNATCETLQINGTSTDFEDLASISCYLTQDIHLNDLLTVEENMQFAADFKLGVTHSSIEKTTIISELLESFGLSSTRKTRAEKLSGGERKRLALALEMISDPRIIYLDEPTTGLDISTTHQILSYLKKIANSGKTVICTIHQVCASHFDLFDLAYVIAEGQCAYQGRPQDLVPFLDQHGLPCNIYHNPADYLMELCCGDFGKDKVGHLVKASQNGNDFIESRRSASDGVNKNTNNIKHLINDNATWTYKFRVLMRREYVKMSRNWLLTYLRILGSTFLSMAIGIIFWDVGADASKVLFNHNWVIAITSNIILGGLLTPILSFPKEMDLIKRELHNRYYSCLQYYFTVILLDLPISILTFVSSGLISYYFSGQSLDMDRTIIYVIFIAMLGSVVNAIGFFFGTLVISFNTAIALTCLTQVPMLAFSGYVMMFQDLPWLLERISLACYARAGLQGCLIAVFGLAPIKLPCPEEEDYCFYKEPHKLLLEFGIDPNDYTMSLLVLFIWLFAVRILTYFTMKYRLSL